MTERSFYSYLVVFWFALAAITFVLEPWGAGLLRVDRGEPRSARALHTPLVPEHVVSTEDEEAR